MRIEADDRARANTIRLAARTTAKLMAEARIPDAAEVVRGLGQRVAVDMTDPDMILGSALVVEAKYRTMCRLIEKTRHPTVVDLPCGYTPRALHLTEKGMRYIGFDLPAIAEESGRVLTYLAEHPERMEFHAADATRHNALAGALAEVDGSICVSTDGLMMYYSEAETAAVIENIGGLLNAHGGCWITPDPEYRLQFYLAFRAVLGEGAAEKLAASGEVVAGLWDVGDPASPFIVDPEDLEPSLGNAMECLRRCGLKVKCINLAEYMPELTTYQRMTRAQVNAFKMAMRYCHCWMITPEAGEKLRKRRKRL